MQPAGGVHEHGVDLALDAGADRLERHRRRVAALAAAHGEHADPLAPGLELVGGRGAEGVGGAEDDALPSPTSTRAILPTVVVLPAPLTPTTRTTPGSPSCRSVPERAVHVGPEDGDELVDQQLPQVGAARGGQHHRLGAQPLDDLRGRGEADVGGQEGLLDLLPVVLGELLPGQHGEQAAAQGGLRAGQPGPQPDQPPGTTAAGSREQPAPPRPAGARPAGRHGIGGPAGPTRSPRTVGRSASVGQAAG